MRRALAIALLGTALLVGAMAGSVAWAYEMWKARSVEETERRRLPAYVANALRHSLAAADTYAAIRTLGLPARAAARLTDRLGRVNEYKEFYLRPRRRRDPTREIYKDLYNNTVGILAAAKLEETGRRTSSDRLDVLGRMTEKGIVLHHFVDARVPDFPNGDRPEASDLAAALHAFDRDVPAIRSAVATTLASGATPH